MTDVTQVNRELAYHTERLRRREERLTYELRQVQREIADLEARHERVRRTTGRRRGSPRRRGR